MKESLKRTTWIRRPDMYSNSYELSEVEKKLLAPRLKEENSFHRSIKLHANSVAYGIEYDRIYLVTWAKCSVLITMFRCKTISICKSVQEGVEHRCKNLINEITKEQLRSDLPSFRPGDTVRVHVKVIEGTRERIQLFEGVVIKRRGGGISETFTVRKISYGVGVERAFPVHTPKIAKLEVIRHGKVRRAKLYYLRELRGKKARIKEIR